MELSVAFGLSSAVRRLDRRSVVVDGASIHAWGGRAAGWTRGGGTRTLALGRGWRACALRPPFGGRRARVVVVVARRRGQLQQLVVQQAANQQAAVAQQLQARVAANYSVVCAPAERSSCRSHSSGPPARTGLARARAWAARVCVWVWVVVLRVPPSRRRGTVSRARARARARASACVCCVFARPLAPV